jgi:hypothetical protein
MAISITPALCNSDARVRTRLSCLPACFGLLVRGAWRGGRSRAASLSLSLTAVVVVSQAACTAAEHNGCLDEIDACIGAPLMLFRCVFVSGRALSCLWRCEMLCVIALCGCGVCAVLCCDVLCCDVLCCAVLCCAVLYCTVLYCGVM